MNQLKTSTVNDGVIWSHFTCLLIVIYIVYQ